MSESICTGSHMNLRTFHEEDYWASFQSTIVSGQVLSAEEETAAARPCISAEETADASSRANAGDTGGSFADETTARSASFSDTATRFTNTDAEEDTTTAAAAEMSAMIDEESEENPLNMNLDAIPTSAFADLDDNFYDCPSFEKSPANLVRQPMRFNVVYSPRPYSRPQFYTLQFSSPPETNVNNNGSFNNNVDYLASPRKQRPASARRISPSLIGASAESESSPGDPMRTGSYLVQMIDDFKDLEDHAQSTPMLSSDSGNHSSFCEVSAMQQVRKTLDYQNAETVVVVPSPKVDEAEVSVSNKENFHNGRYSKFVALRRAMEKSPAKVITRSGKVGLLKDYFQRRVNDSIQLYKSRIPVPVRRVRKSPQAKTRALGSPSYQIRKSYKLVASRSSSGSRACPSTATTFSSTGNESFLTRNQRKSSRASRVQSCSDATDAEITSIEETCKSHSTGDLPSDSTRSIKALHSSKITKRTHLKIDAQPRTLSPKKVSAINKRRSVGQQLKKNCSPVKPVCELRKLFTPKKRNGAQFTFNVTQKKPSKLAVPKIVISHQ